MMSTVTTMPAIVVIGGATATGKTAMALEIASRFDAEIIGADSLQVYRLLNIGSAKPTAAERAAAPHHLVDFLDIDTEFHAARYLELATAAIADITGRGRHVVVTGGTGLYIKALLRGLVAAPAGDEALREHFRGLSHRHGVAHLHELLAQKDPLAAGKISPNDFPRIVRALETLEITGQSIETLRAQHRLAPARYRSLLLGLDLPREELYRRIEARVERMLRAGLVEETRGIISQGYSPSLKPLRAVGYKQVVAHLRGEISPEEMAEAIKRETKRYAKRQITWFRHQLALEWFPAGATAPIIACVRDFWG